MLLRVSLMAACCILSLAGHITLNTTTLPNIQFGLPRRFCNITNNTWPRSPCSSGVQPLSCLSKPWVCFPECSHSQWEGWWWEGGRGGRESMDYSWHSYLYSWLLLFRFVLVWTVCLLLGMGGYHVSLLGRKLISYIIFDYNVLGKWSEV